MKQFLFILNLLIISHLCDAQESVDRFIAANRHTGMSEKLHLTLSGWLVRMGYDLAEKSDAMEEINLSPLMKGIRKLKIQILEVSEGKKNDIAVQKSRAQNIQKLLAELRQEQFEDLVIVKESGSTVNLLVREHDGWVSDIMVLVQEADEETVVLQISGKFKMEDISQIINSQVIKQKNNQTN